ncbi:GNAT family N-acetyltransferase [Cellulomonas uda]|nr:GNAT family N-acetyltransferase [Cellulomonas uda]NII66322.1 GNAT superfamily N-acetyltransferase [Cellulomonas uda]
MHVVVSTPTPDELPFVVETLRTWQDESAPLQLHPGDLGWSWRDGTSAVAAAVRTWTRDGMLVAVGFLDGPDALRMTVAPGLWRDDDVARHVVEDVSDPGRGVLPEGAVAVEAPNATRVFEVLGEAGWRVGEPWTPLRRDLAEPVDAAGLRVEVVEAGRSAQFTAVHRAVWGNDRFTDERWRAMADGPAFARARCLLGRDSSGVAVAGVTVWSAGRGRPGLIEPMGVHPEHRGRGHGRAICLAAAAALREAGSSSALVCTPAANEPAVAAYRSAGFVPEPVRLDRSRPA